MFSLIWTALGMIIIPVSGFFLSKIYIFEGMHLPVSLQQLWRLFTCVYSLISWAGLFDYDDGGIPAAFVAVFLIHVVMVGYACVAWMEGREPPLKQD